MLKCLAQSQRKEPTTTYRNPEVCKQPRYFLAKRALFQQAEIKAQAPGLHLR